MNFQKEIEFYEAKKPDLTDLLELYVQIYELQNQHESEIELQTLPSAEEIKASLEEGKPILSKSGEVWINEELFQRILSEVGRIVGGKGKFKNQIESFLTLPIVRDTKSLLAQFMEEKTFLFQLSMKSGLNVEAIRFLLLSSLVPFYQSQAKEVMKMADYSLWQKGICPYCGHRPEMAKFRKEDGMRILQCPLCRTEWPFPRMKCPFCDNSDHKSLGYLFAEDDRGHRLDVCEICKGYIRTVDERILERETILLIEEIVTRPLSVLAQKRGYKRS